MEWFDMDGMRFNEHDALIAETISNSEYMEWDDPVGHPIPLECIICCFESRAEAVKAINGAKRRGFIKVKKHTFKWDDGTIDTWHTIALTEKGAMVEW